MGRIIPIVLGVLAAAGTALAAFLVATAMTGTVTTGDFAVYLNSGVSATTNDMSVCAVSKVSATELGVVWTGGIAGSECVVSAPFQGLSTNARNAVLESVTGLPVGISGVLGADCGAVINGSGTVTVTLTLLVDTSASPSTSYGLNGAQFVWVPAGTEDMTGCL